MYCLLLWTISHQYSPPLSLHNVLPCLTLILIHHPFVPILTSQTSRAQTALLDLQLRFLSNTHNMIVTTNTSNTLRKHWIQCRLTISCPFKSFTNQDKLSIFDAPIYSANKENYYYWKTWNVTVSVGNHLRMYRKMGCQDSKLQNFSFPAGIFRKKISQANRQPCRTCIQFRLTNSIISNRNTKCCNLVNSILGLWWCLCKYGRASDSQQSIPSLSNRIHGWTWLLRQKRRTPMFVFHNSLTLNFQLKFTTSWSKFHCVAKKVTCRVYQYLHIRKVTTNSHLAKGPSSLEHTRSSRQADLIGWFTRGKGLGEILTQSLNNPLFVPKHKMWSQKLVHKLINIHIECNFLLLK